MTDHVRASPDLRALRADRHLWRSDGAPSLVRPTLRPLRQERVGGITRPLRLAYASGYLITTPCGVRKSSIAPRSNACFHGVKADDRRGDERRSWAVDRARVWRPKLRARERRSVRQEDSPLLTRRSWDVGRSLKFERRGKNLLLLANASGYLVTTSLRQAVSESRRSLRDRTGRWRSGDHRSGATGLSRAIGRP